MAASSLQGLTVFISGASSGLGQHFAHVAANAGASHVILAARRVDKLAAVAQELASCPRVSTVELDVADPASIARVFEGLDAVPDVVVNNAGVSETRRLLDTTPAEYDRVLDTNLRGCFFVMQAAARRCVGAGKGGSIVNVASILGLRVGKGLSAYAASKAGLIHLTKAAALELAPLGIRVNCLAPGYIRTEMNAAFFDSDRGAQLVQQRMLAQRLGRPEELDGAFLLLASPSAGSFMTGTCITVDGGHVVGSLM